MFRKHDPTAARELRPGIVMTPLAWGERTSMGQFHLAKGAHLPLHSHPHEQTGTLISGHLTFTIGDETFDAVPGDSWAIEADVQHAVDVLEEAIIVEVFSPVREAYLPNV